MTTDTTEPPENGASEYLKGETIADGIRFLRGVKGLTDQQIADGIGVSRGMVRLLEQGTPPGTVANLVGLVEWFNANGVKLELADLLR